MQPQWLFPMFALMWVGICALLSMLGGWTSLAGEFRATQRTDGQRFRFVSGSMGSRMLPVSYGGCLFVTVNEIGFGLSLLFPFRPLSPPLFIPWTEVASAETKRFFFREVAPSFGFTGTGQQYRSVGAGGKSIVDAFARVSKSTPHWPMRVPM